MFWLTPHRNHCYFSIPSLGTDTYSTSHITINICIYDYILLCIWVLSIVAHLDLVLVWYIQYTWHPHTNSQLHKLLYLLLLLFLMLYSIYIYIYRYIYLPKNLLPMLWIQSLINLNKQTGLRLCIWLSAFTIYIYIYILEAKQLNTCWSQQLNILLPYMYVFKRASGQTHFHYRIVSLVDNIEMSLKVCKSIIDFIKKLE